jgi:hypothetical protein
MQKKAKGFYFLISSIFISLLHLPFAFGRHLPASKLSLRQVSAAKKDSLFDPSSINNTVQLVYDSLNLEAAGLSRKAFDYAIAGWNKLLNQDKLWNDSIIAIADFSQPSSQKRLYVLDIKNFKLLFHTLVAHGRNSGKEWATFFSNRPASYKSSPGFYITKQTYHGSNGYSLKLDGIESGINDKASRRAIVMHGADYVDESYIASQGYIGRSQGCPAIPLHQAKQIINTIKEGTCFYIYTANRFYSSRSSLLREFSRGKKV